MVENPLLSENSIKAAIDAAFFLCSDSSQRFGDTAQSKAARHRLVKESKSPTSQESPLNARIFQHLALEKEPTFTKWLDKSPAKTAKNTTGAGAFTVIENRGWSDEFRIRTQVVSTVKQSPPDNTGDRVTEMLSTRGARKIAESCEFMSIERGGYSTFLTLTLDADARKRLGQKVAVGREYIEAQFTDKAPEKFQEIENAEFNCNDISQHRKTEFLGAYTPILDGAYCPIEYKNKSTIQREVSRFFDGLQKMYQRGFECEIDGELHRFAGSKLDENGKPEKLDYLWVAECPDVIDQKTGEVTGLNPHVHVLMRYRVPFKFFDAWSKRVEGIWGQGFAHLEKIKDGEKAGAYMAKAAGYLCKAQGKDKNDQGSISGNRYNISKTARAPDWVCVGRYELGRMGFLLSEAAENFEDKFGFVSKKRDKLKLKLSAAIGKDRQKIGSLLEKTRKAIKRMPRFSKYQAILKGEKQYAAFMEWAANDAPVSGHEWLPEKQENEGFITKEGRGQWIQEYSVRRGLRRLKRRWSGWFKDMQKMNEYLFCGDVLRPCFEGEFNSSNDYEECHLSDYNEWAANDAPKTEGLMYA